MSWPHLLPPHINQAARDGDYDAVRAWFSEHSLETSDERDREARGRLGLEILTLRGLVNRAKLRATSRRSLRRSRNISSSDPALNNLVALPNELCKVLAYWHA